MSEKLGQGKAEAAEGRRVGLAQPRCDEGGRRGPGRAGSRGRGVGRYWPVEGRALPRGVGLAR